MTAQHIPTKGNAMRTTLAGIGLTLAAATSCLAPPPPDAPLTYHVSSVGTPTTLVTYLVGSSGIAQENNALLPWTKTVTTGIGASVSAQGGTDNVSITCAIERNGQLITRNVSSGPYAVVMCTLPR